MAQALQDPRLDHRTKRAIYRAEHRGTKELDLLLGQFAQALLGDQIGGNTCRFTGEERLAVIEWLIAQPDHVLQPWLIDAQSVSPDVPSIVRAALLDYNFRVSQRP